ncbi:MAG: glutamate synthase large subunit [Gammaproteobacteria bacterium]|jgi:glutamate synthase (NADPH/NADH) large chain|nr:glutamate synthase large subunit [Gammaproteobacteria bacterium]MBT3860135.1 glutamate synthase large subunit [Gammaproteobacteria bacterium]MBT3987427.1 glutamate synthase large subunit [Gammaproteobacteria bacterium]MBT4581835.1 glutamate synthase large subunit [Gammaproteobacteria bacterium]MBT4659695.1 glutamate synthase large subunit [Gammaproteobacteria bacterium]
MSQKNRIPLKFGFPEKTGLYDPAQEKDSCGVGFVANIKGQPSHQIMLDAYHLNSRMDHRGGCGFEANTGDGAGILTALPHAFFHKIAEKELGITLPEAGLFAVGNIFLPQIEEERAKCHQVIKQIIGEENQTLAGWREVPIDPVGADVGPAALMAQPYIEQLFIAAEDGLSNEEFERKLYVIRKRFTHALRGDSSLTEAKQVYACSLSTKVIVYKGMLTPGQTFPFYKDLTNPSFETHLAMVHSRFSTNTFPSWDRAQPNRFMSHNGEINTLRGNVNSMVARQGSAKTDVFGDKLQNIFPVIDSDCSDSGSFDSVLEFMLMSGRSLQESVMMMIPEAWQSDVNMDQQKKDFYEYNSALMEPWDGPASIVFSDGHYIGAVLDRNGLRPSRYYVTHDDKVIMASEVGVVHVDPANVKLKGRLQPGKMFLIDFEEGRLIPDEELKQTISGKRPYGQWLAEQKVTLAQIASGDAAHSLDGEDTLQRMQAFGYTTETMQFMLLPLVTEARDPLGSMGNDSALACLSDKPRMIYDYFKQLFAQVTNPPIDSIREEVVMSLSCFIGSEGNLLETTPEQAHRLSLDHPILSNQELTDIKKMDYQGMKSRVIDTTYDAAEDNGYRDALDRICEEASAAIKEGYSFIVLSDRATSASRIPLSALISCGAVHHHLVGQRTRTQIGIVVETGEAREVHHHCLLTGFGADAINPYLAFEALWQAKLEGLLGDRYDSEDELVAAYKKGVAKGMLKVMAKMGISTLQSYKGAQIFEAVGLAEDIIDRCFVGTASRVQGVNFDVLVEESKRRHNIGFPTRDSDRIPVLSNPGDFHWRSGGDSHMWNPDTIFNLQLAARNNSSDAYTAFAKHSDEDATRRCTFRGLLKFNADESSAISIDEVEPASEIVKRFATGAMSFGSISQESHESLAIAMNRLGGKSNTGEGGEDPARFSPMANGDSKRSSIKQIASGRFGVTAWYLTNADELQIKIAQGAKPGEGGELPGTKVDENIARIRHSTPGVGLISPPPHHDIYSIEDIAQLIHDLKNANREARISVKLVAEIGVGTIAAGVTKAKTDHLVIAGHDGGTGASPLTSIKHAGLPWELGLAETHQTLVMNNLRSRVILQTDGQLKTGRDIAIAALLGAEEFGFATAPLITLGCIMMRKCHLNTCPVGIATQDPALRKKFKGKPEHVVNYLFMVAEHMRSIMAELGVRTVNEMIGRVDLLDTNEAIDHWKASGLDLSSMLEPAKVVFEGTEFYKTMDQDHGLDKALDNELIRMAAKALDTGEKVHIESEIININRVVGTMLSNEVAKRFKEEMLPEDTINISLKGSAGQSLGAFLAKGITLTVEGDANDYVGKGLSGGKIIIYPPRQSTFKAEENIIAGNVNLYGATAGEAYIRGIAAERFAVRNSGASAVVEGIGDHGCEYMTGGRVVVLGTTGRNFGAGMSGGVAYVWDPEGKFPRQCNKETFELESISDREDILELETLIKKHHLYTDSPVAERILENWEESLTEFVKVMPTDYKRVLAERAAAAA